MVGNVFGEAARGVAQDQPEKHHRIHQIKKQRYFYKRINQVSAQEGVHTRELAFLQAFVPQHMARGADKEPHAENREQNKTDRAGTDQYGQVAVMEVDQHGREVAVMIGEFDALFKHLLTVLMDIALADADNGIF